MSNFANIDKNNIVLQVIDAPDLDWVILNLKGNWIETDLELHRKRADIGDLYDPKKKQFYPQKPFSKFVFNENLWIWEPPIPYPTDGNLYIWDDNLGVWEQVN